MEKLLKENGLVQKVHNTLDTNTLTTVHYLDGTVCDFKYLNVIMMYYANQDKTNICLKEEKISHTLNQEELKVFTITVLYQYILADCPAAEKWIFYFAAIHGGEEVVYLLKNVSENLIANSRKAMTIQIAKALILSNNPSIITALDIIGNKWRTEKNEDVKKIILNKVNNFSESLELSDNIDKLVKISDFGFDMTGRKVVDYGNRKFHLVLDSKLNVTIRDENNKVVSKIPAVIQDDNQVLAAAQNSVLKDMKSDLEKIIKTTKYLLSVSLSYGNTWSFKEFNTYFVNHAILRKYAISTIWATVKDGKINDTFRYTEEGTFSDKNDNEFSLKDTDVITIVHPYDLDEDSINKWKSQLADYDLIQHFDQLERKVYKKDAVEHEDNIINSYNDIYSPYIPFTTIMENGGWSCHYDTYCNTYKDISAVLLATRDWDNSTSNRPSGITIKTLYFMKNCDFTLDSIDKCENVLPLSEVDDKVFSEVIYQMSIVTIKRGKK